MLLFLLFIYSILCSFIVKSELIELNNLREEYYSTRESDMHPVRRALN